MNATDNTPYISVIIPVFNGEHTIKELFSNIKEYFNSSGIPFEVIFVHDCGPDNSLAILNEIYNKNTDHVKLVLLTRNYGQHNAIIAGIRYSLGTYVVTMDEDLQHNPQDIEKLLVQQSIKDFDVVYGKYEDRKHSIIRNLGSSLLKKLISIGIPDVHPDYSAYRLMKIGIAKALIDMENSYTFIDGYISWITTHCSSCTVSHSERKAGKSAYNIKKLVNHSVNIFVTFSDLPLKILSITSFCIFTITSVYSIYILIRKLTIDDFETGFPSLIISIGFGVAAIMLSLGIIGEYIYRINLKTTKKPNYKVRMALLNNTKNDAK